MLVHSLLELALLLLICYSPCAVFDTCVCTCVFVVQELAFNQLMDELVQTFKTHLEGCQDQSIVCTCQCTYMHIYMSMCPTCCMRQCMGIMVHTKTPIIFHKFDR